MVSISFHSAFTAIFQIFLLGAVGFFIVYRKLLDEQGLRTLSWLSINVAFPFFIFNQIILNFNPKAQAYWWTYPLINIGVCLTGVGIAFAVAKFFNQKDTKEWVAVSSFHNAGYIPLLLIAMLPFDQKAGELYSYVILTIIGFDLCLWTIGVWLISYRQKTTIDWKNFLNPPLVSMFLAFGIVLLGFKEAMPQIIMKPIQVMGDSALAVAMLTIGGNLALTQFRKIQYNKVAGAVFLKLIVLPTLAFIFLRLAHVQSIWGFILMIQACMPVSVTMSVLGRYYNNPKQDLINQTIFISHVLCGLSIPLFLGLYGRGY